MKNEIIAALLVLLVIASAGTGYLVGVGNQRTTTSTTTLSTVYVSKSRVFTMNVNGSLYYADDVSNDTVVQNPGYAYFLNASVTFSGVRFEMICPTIYAGCPIPTGTAVKNQTIVLAGAFRFNMTFPDGSTETTGNIIGDSTYVFALSQHTDPRAGILIEYVEYNYPHNFPPYHAFLLVSSSG